MTEIVIGTNEQGQRLDRFLRKYLPGAPLSFIYKIIRKDVKVNRRREGRDYMLEDGDTIMLFLDQNLVDSFRQIRAEHGSRHEKVCEHGESLRRGIVNPDARHASMDGAAGLSRRNLRVAYEDNDVLIADKPAGLLTHGDKSEKSRHLTNQVQNYLIEKGEYVPRLEKTFAPSPVNRIDRNTSGLVIFAKNYDTLKRLNEYIREREKIRKFYLTIVCGRVTEELMLSGMIEKDEARNISRMTKACHVAPDQSEKEKQPVELKKDRKGFDRGKAGEGSPESEIRARNVLTYVRPIASGTVKELGGAVLTVCEVEIETGRTHQIRVQLSDAGHPLAGDPKYGDPEMNRKLRESFGLSHQLLTAARLEFGDMEGYPELSGRAVSAKLPGAFRKIRSSMKKI